MRRTWVTKAAYFENCCLQFAWPHLKMKFCCDLCTLWCFTNATGVLLILLHTPHLNSLIFSLLNSYLIENLPFSSTQRKHDRLICLLFFFLPFLPCTQNVEKFVSKCVEYWQECYVKQETRVSPQVEKPIAYYRTHAYKIVHLIERLRI